MMIDGDDEEEEVEPSLVDLLKEFTTTELLQQDNKYFCDTCNKKCDAAKRVRLHHLPDVLVIHVNRAFWFPDGGKHKITTHVNFPLTGLDLTPFLTDDLVSRGYVHTWHTFMQHIYWHKASQSIYDQ